MRPVYNQSYLELPIPDPLDVDYSVADRFVSYFGRYNILGLATLKSNYDIPELNIRDFILHPEKSYRCFEKALSEEVFAKLQRIAERCIHLNREQKSTCERHI